MSSVRIQNLSDEELHRELSRFLVPESVPPVSWFNRRLIERKLASGTSSTRTGVGSRRGGAGTPIPPEASPTPKARSTATWLVALAVCCAVLILLLSLDPALERPPPPPMPQSLRGAVADSQQLLADGAAAAVEFDASGEFVG
uniref:LEM domain-containing protein n=1 Tax=Macrostomum lignano TaxID=282301 RepID=A0A1I8IGH9_9PLAT